MHPLKESSTSQSANRGHIGTAPIPATPANSPCQSLTSLVHSLLSTRSASSLASPSPQFFSSTVLKNAPFWGYRAPKLFRINTYKKQGVPRLAPCIHFRVTQNRFLRSADAF